jgi:hypothetical protein
MAVVVVVVATVFFYCTLPIIHRLSPLFSLYTDVGAGDLRQLRWML